MLYSNYKFIKDINLFKTSPGPMFGTRELVNETRSDGKRSYSGNSALRGSQAYPSGFGRAMRLVIMKNANEIRAKKSELRNHDRVNHMVRDSWSDANVADVIEYLTR